MTLFLLIVIAIAIYYVFIYKQTYTNIFANGESKKCPNCGNGVEKNFNVCPICKETLKKKCSNCENMVEVNWKYCPFCEITLEKEVNK